MTGYSLPEEAAVAGDRAPPEVVEIVAVDYSPQGSHALVFVRYSHVVPYVVLCEKTPAGWVAGSSGSGGSTSWMPTTDDNSLGVESTWWPRTVRWDVPADNPDPL